jgi:hypothetical protein
VLAIAAQPAPSRKFSVDCRLNEGELAAPDGGKIDVSVNWDVAVHAADWPTPAALNRRMSNLDYPSSIGGGSSKQTYWSFMSGQAALTPSITFDHHPVGLIGSIIKLAPGRGLARRHQRRSVYRASRQTT